MFRAFWCFFGRHQWYGWLNQYVTLGPNKRKKEDGNKGAFEDCHMWPTTDSICIVRRCVCGAQEIRIFKDEFVGSWGGELQWRRTLPWKPSSPKYPEVKLGDDLD